MIIIPMNGAHVPQIAELEKCCFSDPWSERSIGEELENPLSLWLAAEEKGKVIGYVGSQTVMGWTDMMNIAVDPEYRRRGVAEALIEKLIEALKEMESTCLTLEVRESNEPAKLLYEKLGFVCVGKRPKYYHNPREDALILRKEWTL